MLRPEHNALLSSEQLRISKGYKIDSDKRLRERNFNSNIFVTTKDHILRSHW